MRWLKFLTFLVICRHVHSLELKGLQLLVSLISGEFMEPRTRNEDETATVPATREGYTNYTFIDFITFPGKKICDKNDPNKTLNQGQKPDGRRPPIKVKCLGGRGNNTVHVVQSMKDALTVLTPHGNSTKRSVEGNCTLVLFYTKSCLSSAVVAPHYNALARQFPDIKVAAIDAFKFYTFNTEFGIVGLPTIMLFHQGRPIVKFNDSSATVNNFANFVTKHTGIKAVSNSAYVTSEDFQGPLSSKVEKEPDPYLYLAWAFIAVCGGYYFTKSKLYTQIIEMIKRNWQESEAQHEGGS